MNWPRISIVTPSFNQGAFLEETIESVLGQGYPNLEYIIMDGGSTDGSVEILRKYEKHFSYCQSQADGGQANAIVHGLRRATGDILAWLNSDDVYLPGALRHAAGQLDVARAQLLFGNCFHFIEGTSRGIASDVVLKHQQQRLDLIDYLIQPSTFWTRPLSAKLGELDPTLSFTFDWDWFIRAQRAGADFLPTAKYLSAYRLHTGHKSAQGGARRQREILEIYSRYQKPETLAAVDLCRRNYRSLDRWRHRYQRWPLFKEKPAEYFLRHFPIASLRKLPPGDLRDILDMLAGDPEPAPEPPLPTVD